MCLENNIWRNGELKEKSENPHNTVAEDNTIILPSLPRKKKSCFDQL